jgi:hypothetical protein
MQDTTMKHTEQAAESAKTQVANLLGKEIVYTPKSSSVAKGKNPTRRFKVLSLERVFFSLTEKAYSFTAKVVDLDDGNTEKFRSFNLNLVA